MSDTFKLDFTEDDKNSTSKSYEPGRIPSGPQPCAVTDIDIAQVKSGANQGKSYWKVELTIQDGPFENSKLWPNIMLFNVTGGNWFMAQFLKATGHADALETGDLPLAGDFIGAQVVAQVKRVKDKYKNDKEPRKDGSSWYKNEVGGFVVDEDATATSAPKGRTKKASLLPS